MSTRRALARRRAAEITAHLTDPEGLDLREVAEQLGVQVVGKALARGTSGMLVAKGGNYVAVINDADSYYRQRFTTAHELGHRILHARADDQFIDFRHDDGADPMEVEASEFAACLLMPERLVRACLATCGVDVHDDGGLHEMSSIFGVSNLVMTYRLMSLRLLPRNPRVLW